MTFFNLFDAGGRCWTEVNIKGRARAARLGEQIFEGAAVGKIRAVGHIRAAFRRHHEAIVFSEIEQRLGSAIGRDLYEPLAVALARELREHLPQVREVRAQLSVKRRAVGPPRERARHVCRISVNRDAAAFGPRPRGQLSDADRGFTILIVFQQAGGHLALLDKDAAVRVVQHDL